MKLKLDNRLLKEAVGEYFGITPCEVDKDTLKQCTLNEILSSIICITRKDENFLSYLANSEKSKIIEKNMKDKNVICSFEEAIRTDPGVYKTNFSAVFTDRQDILGAYKILSVPNITVGKTYTICKIKIKLPKNDGPDRIWFWFKNDNGELQKLRSWYFEKC